MATTIITGCVLQFSYPFSFSFLFLRWRRERKKKQRLKFEKVELNDSSIVLSNYSHFSVFCLRGLMVVKKGRDVGWVGCRRMVVGRREVEGDFCGGLAR